MRIVTTGTLVLVLWGTVWFWVDWGLRTGMGAYLHQSQGVIPEPLMSSEWNEPNVRPPFFQVSFAPEMLALRGLGNEVSSIRYEPNSDLRHQTFYYDRQARRFERIDTEVVPVRNEAGEVIGFAPGEREVVKGPVIPEEQLSDFVPVQVDAIYKGLAEWLDIRFYPPARELGAEEDRGEPFGGWKEIKAGFGWGAGEDVLVLGADGTIRRLDKETLTLGGMAGYLPPPRDLFGAETRAMPERLPAYRVYPLSRTVDGKTEYLGMLAVSISYGGYGYGLQFFDTEGMPTEMETGRETPTVPIERIASQPGGLLILTGKAVVENLQPAGLNAGSIVLADTFESRAALRGMFVRPNILGGIFARSKGTGFFTRYGFAFLTILPSVALGLIVGFVLRRRALRLGESRGAGRLWFVLGLLLGIPAWITFAIVRPRAALVTCGNCGELRRPDRARCHACGAGWDLEYLAAPAWRVKDAAEGEEDEGAEATV